jgi:monofunctional biosynthetic peptidoglycan transglycosylase
MKTTRISRERGRERARRKKRPARKGRLRRFVGIAVLAVLIAPALPIAVLRFAPPPGSALMLQRWAEARAAGRSFHLAYDWVPAERIAPALRAAVVASEDQRFFAHRGFDFVAMRGALGEWRDGERLRGASTISQQLAKNLFLWPGRSVLRKALEAWLTAWLEALWPKERILEVYLNVVELGDGVFGAEAAARRYFGHGAAALDAHEAALLAAMLPSPRRSNPLAPSRTLRERQAWILRQL